MLLLLLLAHPVLEFSIGGQHVCTFPMEKSYLNQPSDELLTR